MKFSVVTISYNQADFLADALSSVLDQNFYDLEYIVVDAGSTDGSRDIIENYRARLSHVVLEPDDGPAAGLNKGLELATGDIFYYLNADDLVLPGAFRYVAEKFSQPTRPDVVCGGGKIVDSSGRGVKDFRPCRFTLKDYAWGACVALQQATFFRRSAIGDTRFNEQNRTSWDGEFLVDLALKGKSVETVGRPLGSFRQHPTSISTIGENGVAAGLDHRRLFEKIVGRPLARRDSWTSFGRRVGRRLLASPVPE